MTIITLLTDFGTQDGYVAAVKGVLLSIDPTAVLVDVTHDVPLGDVRAGAFALAQAARWFPPGTIHVAVVDPGVGGPRRALVASSEKHRFVGPDNGLLSLALPRPRSARAIAMDRLPADWIVHPTFHGRDLFAPVAARLAAGLPVEELLGEEVTPVVLQLPAARAGAPGETLGEVLHVDRFGNLVTNLPSSLAPSARFAVEVAGAEAIGGRTYSDVAPGQLVAYPGSAGFLEVAVSRGSATATLGVGRAAAVRLSTGR